MFELWRLVCLLQRSSKVTWNYTWNLTPLKSPGNLHLTLHLQIHFSQHGREFFCPLQYIAWHLAGRLASRPSSLGSLDRWQLTFSQESRGRVTSSLQCRRILGGSWLEWILQNQVSARRLELNKIIFRQIAPTLLRPCCVERLSIYKDWKG